VRRNGPTEPYWLMGPTRPGPAEQPPHAAGARCYAPGAAWIVPESWPAAQGRPASSRQQAGYGTAGRCSSGRTRGRGWRIAGRGLVTGGFLLCGWLVSCAGHAAAAETGKPATLHHDLIATASQITGSTATRHALSSTGGLPRTLASAVSAATDQPGRALAAPATSEADRTSAPAGRTLAAAIPTAPAAVSRATTTPATVTPSTPVKPAVPSAAVRSVPAATRLAELPSGSPTAAPLAGPVAAASDLATVLRTAVAGLAAPLPHSLGGPATSGVVPGTLTLLSVPSLAPGPVASIPVVPDVTSIVPAGVNPGGVNKPAGNLPGSRPLMRMALRPASGPAHTARPAVTGTTMAPGPVAAAQHAASWTRRAPQQHAGAQHPAVPHRPVPGGKPGLGAATQTDPAPAGGASAAQVAVQLPSRSGQPNPAGWLIRMRMSRSPAGLQRADDPAVSPD
jgi:hypothetical protein